jgi:hypothetical protein
MNPFRAEQTVSAPIPLPRGLGTAAVDIVDILKRRVPKTGGFAGIPVKTAAER